MAVVERWSLWEGRSVTLGLHHFFLHIAQIFLQCPNAHNTSELSISKDADLTVMFLAPEFSVAQSNSWLNSVFVRNVLKDEPRIKNFQSNDFAM